MTELTTVDAISNGKSCNFMVGRLWAGCKYLFSRLGMTTGRGK